MHLAGRLSLRAHGSHLPLGKRRLSWIKADVIHGEWAGPIKMAVANRALATGHLAAAFARAGSHQARING